MLRAKPSADNIRHSSFSNKKTESQVKVRQVLAKFHQVQDISDAQAHFDSGNPQS